MTYFFTLVFLLSLLPIGYTFAFGEVRDFSTNQSLYHDDDQLQVTGNVSYDPDVSFVTIQIFTPGKSNFADFDTVSVNSDGSFSTKFHVGGPTWSSDGIYLIKVTYAGSLEDSIEYKKFSETTITSNPPAEDPITSNPPAEDPITSNPPADSDVILDTTSNFITLKFKIPNFPAIDKTPQYYIDRYNDEQSYKIWFDSQFPNNSISDVVGYKSTHVIDFPAIDKTPQYYIDRYNDEQSYKIWFDSQFPNNSIYNVLGYEDPISVPDWIKNNAEWWAIGEISDSDFVSGIEFMVENNLIMVSNISPSGNVSSEEIPIWIRNNAHWWSQDLISEDEFVNSLKFLIQEKIIMIN